MNRRIKVVHLIATNFVGGPEKQILEHGRRLRDHDEIDFCLVTFLENGQENELWERARAEGIRARVLKTSNPFNPKVIGDLGEILAEEECDLLVTHGYKSNIVGRFATWKHKLPQISVSRGWTAENWKIRLYEKLDRVFLRFMDNVIAVSHGQRKKLLDCGIRPEKVTVLHNAINLTSAQSQNTWSLRAELGVGEETRLVVGAGRLSPEKNFAGFVDVARLVLEKEPDVFFAIFGEGDQRQELEAQIRRHFLEGRVLLPGFRRDFAAVLDQADLFVQTSFTEGLPNVILEAFGAKRPVVATDVGGTGEVVEDGRSGFLVHSASSEMIAERILHLLGNPEQRKEMGEIGYSFVSRKFNFSHQTDAYRELYLSLVKTESNPAPVMSA